MVRMSSVDFARSFSFCTSFLFVIFFVIYDKFVTNLVDLLPKITDNKKSNKRVVRKWTYGQTGPSVNSVFSVCYPS